MLWQERWQKQREGSEGSEGRALEKKWESGEWRAGGDSVEEGLEGQVELPLWSWRSF